MIRDSQNLFRTWLGGISRTARIVVFCHFDADGLAAGALLGRGLERMGYTDVEVVPSGRGESAFSDEARRRIAALAPDALVVTDLGVNGSGILPGVPTLYIDHHRPNGVPDDATVISSYTWDPIPNSSWLAWDLLSPLVNVEDIEWIAALGTISDLGEKASWSRLAELRKRYSARRLKEAVTLINSARRAAAFDIATPLDLLMTAPSPGVFMATGDARIELLRGYRREIWLEMNRARQQDPLLSPTTPFALLRINSPCQVHPLLAHEWRAKLPERAVICANSGYLPGLVAFSTRTARTDLKLPEIYGAIHLTSHPGPFGQGHDSAAGGQLPPEAFAELMEALGFGSG